MTKEKNAEVETMFKDFRADDVPLTFGKKKYGELVGQTVSTISSNICSGKNIVKYSKMGGAKNAQVLFNLRDICEFIVSQKVEVA